MKHILLHYGTLETRTSWKIVVYAVETSKAADSRLEPAGIKDASLGCDHTIVEVTNFTAVEDYN